MRLRFLGAVAALIAFLDSSVWATTITYEVNNIAGNTWEYIYTVSNDTLGIAIEEFTILFDVGDYGNLVVTTTPVDWDPLVIQPDPNLPDDGFYDALELTGVGIAAGDSLGGFSVQFDFLGTGTPGDQPIDVIDPLTFGVLDSGFTQASAVPVLVNVSGTIKTVDGSDICAMVLASGQFMFSCNPMGDFSLANLPREQNGTVKRQVYADGFFPKIDIMNGSSNDALVMTRSGACPSYNATYSPGFVPDSAGKRINITGKVLSQNSQSPICAMVLANGQHVFSCDGAGTYALNIPLDSNGQFKLQVYADGFAPTIQHFDEFNTTNNVRMARAVECQ